MIEVLGLVLAMLAPPPEPPVALLAPGLGMGAEVFELPGTMALGERLREAGYETRTVDLTHGDLAARAAAVRSVLDALEGRAVVGVGFGLGGTALFQNADHPTLRALVGIGAPLSFGASSPAQRRLFRAEGPLTWARLGGLRFAGRPLAKVLLTDGLKPRVREAFFARAARPIDAALLAELARLAEAPIPTPLPGLDGLKRSGLRVLAVVAPGDHLAPPWQSDPATLGLGTPLLTRIYATRADGFVREYDHLDLLLHPDAWGEVHPKVVEWLEAQDR